MNGIRGERRAVRLAGRSGARLSATVNGRAVRGGGLVGGIVLLALLPNVLNPYWQFVGAQTLISSIAVLSVVVLFRTSSALSLSQAAFMGIGACGFSAAAQNWHVPMLPAALIGVAIAAGSGLLMSIPALRLRGLDLSVLTLAVALAADGLVFSSDAPLRPQEVGASIDPVTIFGQSLSLETNAYYFALIVAVAVFAAVIALLRGPVGQTWTALRAGRAVAASVGVRIVPHKIAGFALSAALAGLAGVLLLTIQTTTDAATFSVPQSLVLVVAAMLGGIERPLGATMGALTVVAGPQITAQIGLSGDWVLLASGLVALVFVIELRGGIRADADV